MKFDEWAEQYFGPNVDVPEACRDAWKAALLEAAAFCYRLGARGLSSDDCGDGLRQMAEGK